MPGEDLKFAQIVAQIAPHSLLLQSWPLAGGISAQMTALEIQRPDGRTQKLIVRQPGATAFDHQRRAAENEFKMLQVAKSLGLTAPHPIALDVSGSILPTPFLVSEYIDGQMDFAPVNPVDYAVQMAKHLAQIHQVDGARADLSFLPHKPIDLAALIGKGPPQVNIVFEEGRIRETLERAWPNLKHNRSTLLHGDFWPGNILWQGENLAAVIDWEDACTGEPLSDLAISRLDMLWIIGLDAMQAFTHEYLTRIRLEPANLPYWDLYAALRLARLAGDDLAGWTAFFHPYGRRDITPESFREHYRYFISQAFENTART